MLIVQMLILYESDVDGFKEALKLVSGEIQHPKNTWLRLESIPMKKPTPRQEFQSHLDFIRNFSLGRTRFSTASCMTEENWTEASKVTMIAQTWADV